MGSYLVSYQDRIVKITTIDTIAKCIRGIFVGNEEDTDWFNEDDADSIPLTDEILEKNGWKWRKKGVIKSLHLYDKEGHSIMTLTYGNIITVGGHEVKIRYVHELQYALRLCGLNELADNFKV